MVRTVLGASDITSEFLARSRFVRLGRLHQQGE